MHEMGKRYKADETNPAVKTEKCPADRAIRDA
jgi:hypothetical protein